MLYEKTMIFTVRKYNDNKLNYPRMAMSRVDGDDTKMEKPKGVRKAKGGKGFTGYQPGDSSLRRMKSLRNNEVL